MSEIELIEGKEYLFCIGDKWRIGKLDHWGTDENAKTFVTTCNVAHYVADCTQVIPLELAVNADHFKLMYDDERTLRIEFIEAIHRETKAPEYEYPGQVIRDVRKLQAENARLTAEIHRVIEMIGHAIEINERTAPNVKVVKMLSNQYRIIVEELGKALQGGE